MGLLSRRKPPFAGISSDKFRAEGNDERASCTYIRVCVCSHESNCRQRLLSSLPLVLSTFVRAKCSAGIAQLQ